MGSGENKQTNKNKNNKTKNKKNQKTKVKSAPCGCHSYAAELTFNLLDVNKHVFTWLNAHSIWRVCNTQDRTQRERTITVMWLLGRCPKYSTTRLSSPPPPPPPPPLPLPYPAISRFRKRNATSYHDVTRPGLAWARVSPNSSFSPKSCNTPESFKAHSDVLDSRTPTGSHYFGNIYR